MLNARTFSGLLLDSHGAISGAVDATFTASGRAATVRMTAGTRVARFPLYLPAGSNMGSRLLGFGTLTLTRNADGTVSASLASSGDLLDGVLQPRHAPAAPGRYNAALASIDAAIPGGGYLFVNTLTASGAFLVGRLPDGQVFSASTSVRDDGTIAFYAVVRGGVNPPEIVGGELVFADLTATDFTGELAWAKPVQRPGVRGLHLGGVNTILTVNGCQFKRQPLPAGAGESEPERRQPRRRRRHRRHHHRRPARRPHRRAAELGHLSAVRHLPRPRESPGPPPPRPRRRRLPAQEQQRLGLLPRHHGRRADRADHAVAEAAGRQSVKAAPDRTDYSLPAPIYAASFSSMPLQRHEHFGVGRSTRRRAARS